MVFSAIGKLFRKESAPKSEYIDGLIGISAEVIKMVGDGKCVNDADLLAKLRGIKEYLDRESFDNPDEKRMGVLTGRNPKETMFTLLDDETGIEYSFYIMEQSFGRDEAIYALAPDLESKDSRELYPKI